MRPSEKWTNFVDVYATMEPIPTANTIFRAMKSQEERLKTQNEEEYEEANFAGNSSGHVRGAGGSDWRRPKIDIRRSEYGSETRNCYCYGEKGHLAKDCPSQNKTCEICDKRGHLAIACRSRPSFGTTEEEDKTEETAATQERS